MLGGFTFDVDTSEFQPSSIMEGLEDRLRRCLVRISEINDPPLQWKKIIDKRLTWLEKDKATLDEKWKEYKPSSQFQHNFKGMPKIA